MKVMILQLSDIHLEDKVNPVEKKISKIVDVVRNLEVDLRCAILLISGDVAWSGKTEEYERAKQLVSDIKRALVEDLRVETVHVVTVPGNHDCDFKLGGQLRDIVISNFSGGTGGLPDENVIDACCGVQKPYFEFASDVETVTRDAVSKLYWEFNLKIDDYEILLKCYNSAWVSTLHEKASQLVYPIGLLTATDLNSGADVVISVHHHPTNWFLPNLGRSFREHVDRTSDIVFTGHEHISNAFLKLTHSGEANQYLEGGVLQERGADEISAFNVVFLNLETQSQRIVLCDWKVNRYEPHEGSGGWTSYTRNRFLTQKDFAVSGEFEQYLSDVGASFVHPSKPTLKLEDILVLPNCRVYTQGDKQHLLKTSIVESRDLLKVLTDKRKLLLIGAEKTGKTTLAKVLFTKHFNSGKVPILINGKGINSVNLVAFEQLAEKGLQQQYTDPSLEKYRQLPRGNSVVIIDDFDSAKLNLKGKRQLLDDVCKRYGYVILLSNGLVRIEELASGSKESSIVSEFDQFEISEFGHLLRDKLIEKWFNLGVEYQGDPDEINQQIRSAENRINILLGNSYLPSVPIFILTFLQAISASETTNTAAGSYGYMYEVLITKALSIRQSKIKLDTKYTYLSELAYKMHSEDNSEISPFDLKVFHDFYCKSYKINPSQSIIINELVDAEVLTQVDDAYIFKYKYIYYYFVARYYRDNLHDTNVQGEISKLSAGTLAEEKANILLFLTHLSKDPFIINSILSRSRSIFASNKPLQFDEDVSFLNAIYEQLPKTVLLDKDAKLNKEALLRKFDELEESKSAQSSDKSEGESDESSDHDKEIELLNEYLSAFMILRILGQIVKNFPGSLKGNTKFEVVKECYELGLRSLDYLFTIVKENAPQLIEMVVERVQELNPRTLDEEELQKGVKNLLYTMTEGASFGLIKQISQAVGATDLAETYHEVLEQNKTNSVAVIDMSIKLDHFSFPSREVPKLYDTIKSSVFCRDLLRKLVVNHFYLFPTKYQVKQSICDALDISYQKVQALEQAHKSEKKISRIKRS